LKKAFAENGLIFELYSTSGKIGPGGSRNLGLLHILYRYVCFLDSDDVWEENVISSQLKSIRLNRCCAVCLSCYYFDRTGILNYSMLPKKISYTDFLHTNPINPSMAFFDMNKFENFRFEKKSPEDFRLWLTISKKYGDFICSEDFLVGVRRAPGSLSGNKFRSALWHWRALSDLIKMSFSLRCTFFAFYIVNAVCKRAFKIYRPIYLPKSFLRKICL
jgi:teichuronic acid biosynthesis glycosyltransferase TuaG